MKLNIFAVISRHHYSWYLGYAGYGGYGSYGTPCRIIDQLSLTIEIPKCLLMLEVIGDLLGSIISGLRGKTPKCPWEVKDNFMTNLQHFLVYCVRGYAA